MERRPTQFSTTQLVVLFIVGVVLGGVLLFLGTYLFQNGIRLGNIGGQNAKNMAPVAVNYQAMSGFVNNRISVDGYAIIANDTNNVCGSIGWSTCKVWFSDDPINHGLGSHEIKIATGQSPNSITQEGILFDYAGSRLPLVRTDQFSWYHVKIFGIVEQCQANKCTIDVDTIYGIQ